MFFGLLALSVYLLITDTGNLIFNSISKSVGIMNSLFSFAILQFLIKEFRNNYLGKRQGNNDFEQTINNATNLGEFLKDASLWERILHDKRSRNFFDVNGKILPKTSFNDPQLTEAIISASFFNTLNRFGLYRENYTVKQQIDISKKFFNVGSSIAHDNKRNPELFEWIANLLK